MAGSGSYNKGMTLYNQGNVLEFSVEEDKEFDEVFATVQGSGRNVYDVQMSINTLSEDVEEISCECPAFWDYSGICKHCVAVLLEYNAQLNRQESLNLYMEKKEDSIQKLSRIQKGVTRTTTQSIGELLQRKTVNRMLPMLYEDTYGQVRLEPHLHCEQTKITVDFKLGIHQMYVLKDMFQFAALVHNCEEYRYGKNLQFIHALESFHEESRPLVKLILKWAAANEAYYREFSYYGYYTQAKSRTMDLSGAYLEEFLEIMGDRWFSGTIQGMKETSWRVSEDPLVRKMTITGCEDGIEIKIDKISGVIGSENYIYFIDGKIYRQKSQELEPIRDFLSCMAEIPDRKIFIQKSDVPLFCRELLPELKKFYKCRRVKFDEAQYGIAPVEIRIYLDAPQKDMITCKALACYEEKEYSIYDDVNLALRDLEKEAAVKKLIKEYTDAYDPVAKCAVAASEDVIYELLLHGISRMQEMGEVYISDALKRMEIRQAPKIKVGVSIEGNLLDLTMTAGDMSREELIEILSKYNRKKKFYRLKDGSFVDAQGAGLDAVAELQKGLQLTDKQLKEEHITLQKYRALYLDSQLKEYPAVSAVKDKSFRSLIRDMKTVEDNDFEIPEELDGTLREYQKTGFLWLKTLNHNGFGGILADDMGLGKTLQVIAFLLSEAENRKSGYHQALIVTPASLVYNWENEFTRFAPALSVRVVAGSAAERKNILEKVTENEILLTSYDLLKRDIENYKDKKFCCQVIDEAQFIKNQSTQAAKAVKMIQADCKLALTGTPVENRLSELWSIFDYLMPGFLYSYEKFRKEMELPIVQNAEEDATKRLQKLVQPFILRRLKKDVLQDLPDKLEENMYVKLEGEQQKLYDAHVKRMQILLDKQSDKEFQTSKIVILSELTKLRQICCDPGLLLENYQGESAKMDMCIQMIQNAVENGHKILLFSQFTTMLEELSLRLEKENISFYTLTGATSKEKRARMVEDFNKNDVSVFCISLKAGGTGLNLTAADIVIHYDPWWNLAVQNQATDRAHRIGQKNVVNVYKLIAKGTIEENILKLQEKKRELADQILSGESMGSGSFTKEEILELLKSR
jgi:hypothetical protein